MYCDKSRRKKYEGYGDARKVNEIVLGGGKELVRVITSLTI